MQTAVYFKNTTIIQTNDCW